MGRAPFLARLAALLCTSECTTFWNTLVSQIRLHDLRNSDIASFMLNTRCVMPCLNPDGGRVRWTRPSSSLLLFGITSPPGLTRLLLLLSGLLSVHYHLCEPPRPEGPRGPFPCTTHFLYRLRTHWGVPGPRNTSWRTTARPAVCQTKGTMREKTVDTRSWGSWGSRSWGEYMHGRSGASTSCRLDVFEVRGKTTKHRGTVPASWRINMPRGSRPLYIIMISRLLIFLPLLA
ncbi:hypothetical protein B0T26DRAFT_32326 [Lasiosphaeria miniovina]|uniref:Secreted protein n=1 Tax=Lasiosphaeria miniovina TaxID=1954250 RepID=A0AA40BGA7_9PEZI|nr:uncharacterized protein B0T26DRAFT_32326 [Lasiosphaeria miniovina]KAK0733690.1 hypothetical protein B0T26DRAFT_32326 [Lasiosphaeria miniovina]